jgi:DNA repair protein RadC
MSRRRTPPITPARQQISFVPPDGATLLHLVRENLRLVAQFMAHYEVPGLPPPEGDADAPVIRSPADIAGYLGPELAALAQEQLRVVLLNAKNRVIGVQLVYQGGANTISVRLADCFREAVRSGAVAIILCHNHPSGDPEPSPEDVRVTAEAGRAGQLLGVDVLDHIVVAGARHVSLRERGLYVYSELGTPPGAAAQVAIPPAATGAPPSGTA